MKTRSTTPLQARRGDPRGQVLVLFALMLVVLLLVSALAVDYGGWLVTKRNFQNTTDAAALAGAQQLTRPLTTSCASGISKNFCAREAAWQYVKSALGFTALDPVAQAATSSGANSPYSVEGNYKVWVASPPSDAGSAYLGHVSGTGVVYVRVDHAGVDYLSRIVNVNRSVTAWSTAGRFPANFAVIGMCSPTSITANCLAGDANIKLDGTNTNLIVGTGDLGTNRWTKDGGSSSGVALGPDSNAYMQLFDTCWANASNQCQLWSYNNPNIDTSATRAAIPLGAPIPDPAYAAPPITSTTAPNECRGTGTVQLASAQVLERTQTDSEVADLPIKLASAIQPQVPGPIADAVKLSGTVSSGGVAVYAGVTVDLVNATTNAVYKTTTTDAAGAYGFNGVNNSPPNYYLTVSDSTATQEYATTSTVAVSYAADTVVNVSVSKNPLVSGTVRNANTSAAIVGATVTVTVQGNTYAATTIAGGAYTRYVPTFGALVSFSVTAAATGYVTGGPSLVPIPTAVDQTYTQNFNLTPAPASLTGTITDAVTSLPVPGVTVTLASGGSATTNVSGSYNIASALVGTTTITLSGTATSTGTTLDGYAYATPLSGSSITIVGGANTRDFTLWPKGCYDGGSSGSFGSWSCSWPSGNNCPSTTSPDASDGSLTCAFTQANAIRPGTYTDITLPNNTCAWLDPRGGVTGLATGQMAGIYHVKGTISMGNNSYLFGDGVTIVMDQGSNFDVNNGGGFVLNYGTIKVGGAATCAHPTDFATAKGYNDGTTPCFQTVSPNDTQDYAYAAWTTGGTSPWTTNAGAGCVQATTPVYNTTSSAVGNARCFTPGKDLGITFYMYGSGLGNASRMKLSTASMGYLFNGVLYAPNDDIQLGGGKDGQSAAGQIVGWTIEYHGGTRILQNWYGDPTDGQPFLIEPVLGE
jgi:Flp pilus assembly protein TadG